MSIVQRITELTAAMKARDAIKTNFLRYWIAQLTLGSGPRCRKTMRSRRCTACSRKRDRA